MRKFEVVSPFKPAGDQGEAIDALASGIKAGDKYQVLQGVTGSGKTFTMAKIIEAVQMPTLIVSHNRPWRPSFSGSLRGFSPTTRWSTLSLITITTSRKPIAAAIVQTESSPAA
jgi:excinuclease ABC subunit B